MTIPTISEATIRAHSAPEIYNRGLSYYDQGAVSNLVLRDNLLQASVEGSQYPFYRVHVTFDQDEIDSVMKVLAGGANGIRIGENVAYCEKAVAELTGKKRHHGLTVFESVRDARAGCFRAFASAARRACSPARRVPAIPHAAFRSR